MKTAMVDIKSTSFPRFLEIAWIGLCGMSIVYSNIPTLSLAGIATVVSHSHWWTFRLVFRKL